MCGISGSINHPHRKYMDSVLQSIHHRGPDANGSHTELVGEAKVWFGHTRLSILDLSEAGAQPMSSRDGRWLLSFNGEIYNHLDIRKRLSDNFRGHSDTETLAEALAEHGLPWALQHLNGMYAFAALDRVAQKVYLVRDPFGIKPLYYHQRDKSLFFASEMRALEAMGVPFGVDSQGLASFLALRYVPSPLTLRQNINRLPPGTILCFSLSTGEVTLERYVQPQRNRFVSSLEQAVQAYQEELQRAVTRQLISDVPVGILLSGGIDSALVAAMAKEAGHKLTGFTVGFGSGHNECEIDDAAHTAKVLGLPHRQVTVNEDMLWEALPKIAQSVEEPLGTTSVMPMWYLVQLARQEVTVVLTGQGSDEPWGGYRRYQMELIRRYLPQPVSSTIGRMSKVTPLHSRLPDFLRRGVHSIGQRNIASRFLLSYELFTADERERLIGHRGVGNGLEEIQNWLSWVDLDHLHPAEKQMRIDTRMNLADDLLLYGDKISMAVALEARVPMLDLELMKFVESLPIEYKVQWQKTKIVHKKMAEQFLPKEIVHRKKKGFNVPFGAWSRTVWKDRVASVLLDRGSPHLEYLSRQAIEQIWNTHQRADRSRQIFSLLMLALQFQTR